MALSMDEQRILEEMERNLAADDPRLAARLGSFGQPRLPGPIRSQHARTVGGVLALALIAAVTIMVFVISPFANTVRNVAPPRGPSSSAAANTSSSARATTANKDSTDTATAKSPAGVKTGKTSTGAKAARTSANASRAQGISRHPGKPASTEP